MTVLTLVILRVEAGVGDDHMINDGKKESVIKSDSSDLRKGML